MFELARAAALDPTSDEIMTQLGRSHLRLGHPEREEEVFLVAARARPHSWYPSWMLATHYFRQGDIESAVRFYEAMTRQAPLLHKGYSSLGGVLVLRGEYGRAIETLKRSVELRPTRVSFENLGTAYFNSGRFAEAVDAYNQSFQFGAADYESWINLGDAYYFLRDRKDQAAEAYQQAIQLGREEMHERSQPGRTALVMIPANLSTVFPKVGQPDSARVYLARALAADSANPMVKYCAGLTLWQLGDRPGALAWMERAVRGGYPIVWLRDSPVFRDWRESGQFRSLIGAATRDSGHVVSNSTGG